MEWLMTIIMGLVDVNGVIMGLLGVMGLMGLLGLMGLMGLYVINRLIIVIKYG